MLREVGLMKAIAAYDSGKEVLVLDGDMVRKLGDILSNYRFLVEGDFASLEAIRRPIKEEEPFDYGKLGALIRAGKSIEFLQTEFGCTRAQISARIRVWKKEQEGEANEE